MFALCEDERRGLRWKVVLDPERDSVVTAPDRRTFAIDSGRIAELLSTQDAESACERILEIVREAFPELPPALACRMRATVAMWIDRNREFVAARARDRERSCPPAVAAPL
jgi:hypothetical protein